MKILCASATPTDSSLDRVYGSEEFSSNDLRKKIEHYIQLIMKSHVEARPNPGSQEEIDLWNAQNEEIKALTEEARQIIEELRKHNRHVYDVTTGSVIVKVNCPTLLAVMDLWQLYENGTLQATVRDIFSGEKMERIARAKCIDLCVSICYQQYTKCLDELAIGW